MPDDCRLGSGLAATCNLKGQRAEMWDTLLPMVVGEEFRLGQGPSNFGAKSDHLLDD